MGASNFINIFHFYLAPRKFICKKNYNASKKGITYTEAGMRGSRDCGGPMLYLAQVQVRSLLRHFGVYGGEKKSMQRVRIQIKPLSEP